MLRFVFFDSSVFEEPTTKLSLVSLSILYLCNALMLLADSVIEWIVLPWSILAFLTFVLLLIYEIVEMEVDLEEIFTASENLEAAENLNQNELF